MTRQSRSQSLANLSPVAPHHHSLTEKDTLDLARTVAAHVTGVSAAVAGAEEVSADVVVVTAVPSATQASPPWADSAS